MHPPPPLHPQRASADATMLALSVAWGATFLVVKDALDDAAPFSFLTLRFLLGALVATALVRPRGLTRRAVVDGLVLSPLLFGGFALQTVGLAYTTPSRSAFLTGLMVIVVPIASIALYRRWPRPTTLVGLALTVSGLLLLTRAGSASSSGPTALGDLLSIGCAISYGLHLTLNERTSRGSQPAALVVVQLWALALFSGVGALIEGPRAELTPALLGAVAYCGVVASAIAFTLQTWAQSRTTAVRAVLIFSLEPIFATALSVLVGRERLDAWSVAGGVLMLCGVLAAELGPTLAARRAA